METEQKIIIAFLEENKPKTIREISTEIGSDYKITHTATTKLIQKKILNATTVGASIQCSRNAKYFGPEIYQAEHTRTTKKLKDRNLSEIHRYITKNAPTTFYAAILFGSYANNTQDQHSDIDILFITDDKKFEQTMQQALDVLPQKIHAITLSQEEFRRMKNSTEQTVVAEASNNYVILHGIEAYHQL